MISYCVRCGKKIESDYERKYCDECHRIVKKQDYERVSRKVCKCCGRVFYGKKTQGLCSPECKALWSKHKTPFVVYKMTVYDFKRWFNKGESYDYIGKAFSLSAEAVERIVNMNIDDIPEEGLEILR